MNLFDIVEKQSWIKLQDGFSKVLGVSIWTVDSEGRPISGAGVPNSFCLDVIKILGKSGKEEYEECVSTLIDKVKDKSTNYILCHFGLYLYGIPVKIKEEGALAYILIGPLMIQKKKNLSEYKRIAKKSNIPLDYLVDRLSDLKKFSFVSIESAVELLQEVANDIVQLNYNTKKLKERFDVPEDLDSLIKELYSSVYFEDLLNTLLDASIHTTKGSTGSIMLLDHDRDELSVRFSHGLKDDVVKNTKVKLGEGISGIVAKNKKPLLIDSSIKDSRIKNRLKRPYIKSSIVYPLEVKDRLFGILNLNNIHGKRRFNSETLDLIGNLTRLTSVALRLFPRKVHL